jgi:hypothetical protein
MIAKNKSLIVVCMLLSSVGGSAFAKKDAKSEDDSLRSGGRPTSAQEPQQRRQALREVLTSQDKPKHGEVQSKPTRQLSQDERNALRRELQLQRDEVLTKPAAPAP